MNVVSRSPIFSFSTSFVFFKRPLYAGNTVLSTSLGLSSNLWNLEVVQATDFSLSNVRTVHETDAKLHGNILVINSDYWEWSELEVKHNFVFIKGNHQHDDKSKQQSQILKNELPNWTEAMFFIVTITMQHFWKLKK